MKDINISINKAKIVSYTVTLEEDVPKVTATVGLYAGKKKISTFSLTTEAYYSESIKFQLPAALMVTIVKLAEQLETILTLECSRSLGELPHHVDVK